jgi:predicted amino acid-binding ACT domain protein
MAMLLARRVASSTPRFARLASNGSSFAEPQASVAGAEVRIPPGAIPQIHIEARGKHTAGLIKHVSSFLYGHGASVVASKKIVLGGKFSMLMSVWCPDQKDVPGLLDVLNAAEGNLGKPGVQIIAEKLSAAELAQVRAPSASSSLSSLSPRRTRRRTAHPLPLPLPPSRPLPRSTPTARSGGSWWSAPSGRGSSSR